MEVLNVITSKCDVVNVAGILFLWYRVALNQFHEDGDSLSDRRVRVVWTSEREGSPAL